MRYIVYKITNTVNGKIYIGKHQTVNLNDGYMGSGKRLKDSISHYGIKNFKKEILFEYDNESDMNKKEAELVTEEFCFREDTYNLCPGGNGGFGYINGNDIAKFKGKKHTEETKTKISKSRKGFKHSEESKQKISKASLKTNESRSKKVSKALKNKSKTEEHRKKLSDAIKKWHTERQQRKTK